MPHGNDHCGESPDGRHKYDNRTHYRDECEDIQNARSLSESGAPGKLPPVGFSLLGFQNFGSDEHNQQSPDGPAKNPSNHSKNERVQNTGIGRE